MYVVLWTLFILYIKTRCVTFCTCNNLLWVAAIVTHLQRYIFIDLNKLNLLLVIYSIIGFYPLHPSHLSLRYVVTTPHLYRCEMSWHYLTYRSEIRWHFDPNTTITRGTSLLKVVLRYSKGFHTLKNVKQYTANFQENGQKY